MSVPEISIIVPTFNRARLLREALASCLQGQTGVAAEIVVVDDASTDTTGELLASLGASVRAVRLDQNGGCARARNRGMAEVTGTYVKFLDSDDILEPGSLRAELAVAVATGADIVVSDYGRLVIDDGGKVVPGSRKIVAAPPLASMPDAILAGQSVPTSAALYRRAYLDGMAWDPAVRRPDDWHFFCQAALAGGRIARHAGVAYWLREHPGQRVNAGTLAGYARDHLYILSFIETTVRAQGAMTEARSKRLAQYMYKQIHVVAEHDRAAFEALAQRILATDPSFQPRDYEPRRFIRRLSRAIGFRRAVLCWVAAKRVVNRFRGGGRP